MTANKLKLTSGQSVSLKSINRPRSGQPCGKCKNMTGEWIETIGNSGSWWQVSCDICKNQMSISQIIDPKLTGFLR